jgi:hypothetical protein
MSFGECGEGTQGKVEAFPIDESAYEEESGRA